MRLKQQCQWTKLLGMLYGTSNEEMSALCEHPNIGHVDTTFQIVTRIILKGLPLLLLA
jgi:hypothetical protein